MTNENELFLDMLERQLRNANSICEYCGKEVDHRSIVTHNGVSFRCCKECTDRAKKDKRWNR